MPETRDLRARTNMRDSGLRRLRTATGSLVVAATALAGIFAGIAAGTTPGRRLVRAQRMAATAKPQPSRRESPPVPPPPPLPPLGSTAAPAPTPAPAAPAQPPTTTAAPPVAVSGGS